MNPAVLKNLLTRFTGGSYGPIGVDLGARTIKAVQLRHSGGVASISASVALPMVEQQGDASAMLTAMIRRLHDVLDRQGFRGRDVVLAAPHRRLESDVLELPPRGSGAPIETLARAELGRSSAMSSAPFEMAAWDLPLPARSGGNGGATSTSVMVTALRHKDADELLAAFTAENLNVRAIDTGAWASARACAAMPAVEGITAVVDLGWDAARLVLVGRDTVVYQRSLSEVGLAALHKQIAAGLDIAEDVVQYALSAIGAAHGGDSEGDSIDPGEAARVRAFVVRHADAMVAELNASFVFAVHRYPELPIVRLVIGGGGASIFGLADALKKRVRMHAEVWGPQLAVRGEMSANQNDPALMTAVGLAMHEGD